MARWVLVGLTLITLGRSPIHMFKYDGGAQSIATIPLDTFTPGGSAAVVLIFALWGLSAIDHHPTRVYGAMIRALDRGVGEILEALKKNGLEESTGVVFSSDNGGAHYVGIPDPNAPYRGWKMTSFEGGLHAPFFMKWPHPHRPHPRRSLRSRRGVGLLAQLSLKPEGESPDWGGPGNPSEKGEIQ